MGLLARRGQVTSLGVTTTDSVSRIDENDAATPSYLEDEKSPCYNSSYQLTPLSGKSAQDFTPTHRKRSFAPHTREYDYAVSEKSEEHEPEDEEPAPYVPKRKWRSSRLAPGEVYQKPWKGEVIPRRSWERYIFAAGCLAGSAIGVYLIYNAYTGVVNSDYCNILIDDFQKGINLEVWNFEVQRGGYGVGSFEWTTFDRSNVYTDGAGLHIVPTLTTETTDFTEAQMLDNTVLNLTIEGVCTSKLIEDCGIRSNKTSGSIINPVRSARLTTAGKMTLRYGKVEVMAKLPRGDWLWPAIWMMPENSVYGIWPRSGEIDIMEARGNAAPFPGGRNQMSSALHWGPISFADGYWRTLGQNSLPRSDYSDDFHLYALGWDPKYLFTYVDSRLLQIVYIKWAQGTSMWDKGRFSTYPNQSALNDPWVGANANAPFDQDFYLILNVAVGGTNGFFVDNTGNKPWTDIAYDAQRAFWASKDTWLPTWGAGDTRGMTIQSVKMYTLGKCANVTTDENATTHGIFGD